MAHDDHAPVAYHHFERLPVRCDIADPNTNTASDGHRNNARRHQHHPDGNSDQHNAISTHGDDANASGNSNTQQSDGRERHCDTPHRCHPERTGVPGNGCSLRVHATVRAGFRRAGGYPDSITKHTLHRCACAGPDAADDPPT